MGREMRVVSVVRMVRRLWEWGLGNEGFGIVRGEKAG
jgi:hypothetical protein